MMLQRLKDYRGVLQDIEITKDKISDIKNSKGIKGYVQASSTCPPYAKHDILVHGYDNASHLNNIIRVHEQTLTDLYKEKREVEYFVDHISDRKLRQIIDMYYMSNLKHGEKMTWQRVATRFGWSDEGSPRKKVNDFFENSENSEIKVL